MFSGMTWGSSVVHYLHWILKEQVRECQDGFLGHTGGGWVSFTDLRGISLGDLRWKPTYPSRQVSIAIGFFTNWWRVRWRLLGAVLWRSWGCFRTQQAGQGTEVALPNSRGPLVWQPPWSEEIYPLGWLMLPWHRGGWEDFLIRARLCLLLPTATFISPCFLSGKHVMAVSKSMRSKLSLQNQSFTHTQGLENLVWLWRHLRNTALHFLFILSTCAVQALCWSLLLVGSSAAHQAPKLANCNQQVRNVSAMELPPAPGHVLGKGEHPERERERP